LANANILPTVTAKNKYPTQGSVEFRRVIGEERGGQAEAARRLGTKADTVSRLVSEERGCGLELALKIEAEFGIEARLWTIPLEMPAELIPDQCGEGLGK